MMEQRSIIRCTTKIAWEQMASKVAKLATSSKNVVKFFSVELDRKERIFALKDVLGIEGVLQGKLRDPNQGYIIREGRGQRQILGSGAKDVD